MSIAGKIGLMGFSELFLVEPNISSIPDKLTGKSISITSADKAIKAADIVVLLVDHTPFKKMDLEVLSGKQIVDTRGIWS